MQLRQCLILLLLSWSITLLWGCRETGLQGSTIPLKFKGVTRAQPISPYSVELTWDLQPRFTAYRVYRKGISAVQKDETFAVTQMSNLEPGTTYEFGVTGFEAVSGLEEGYGVYSSVRTLLNFSGLSNQSLKTNPNGTIEVSWIANGENVPYEVYARRDTDNWNFNQPVFSSVGVNRAVIGNLPSGGRYCFWVLAKYKDKVIEPANQDTNYINANAPCALVQTLMPNLPQVNVTKTFAGQFPWFWTEGGDPSYQTEIFKRPFDIRIAVVNGNNYFRALLPLVAGEQDLYAKVTNLATGAVSIVDLNIVGVGVTDETFLTVKALGTSTNFAPVFPRVVNGGAGEQELGDQVVSGDFNCDGIADLAVSAPSATPAITSNRNEATGAVVVYYGYLPTPIPGQPAPKPRLNTTGEPTADNFAPHPHLLFYTDLASQTKMGVKLAVANINRDCFARYAVTGDPFSNSHGDCENLYSPNNTFSVTIPTEQDKIKRVYQCNDLVIKTNSKAIFVSYGDPLRGLVSGSGGSSYGIDEFTCDISSNRCRPVSLNMQSTQSIQDITVGDFNNDGYDDIAASTIATGSTPPSRLIKILKGSSLGVTPDTLSASEKHLTINLLDSAQFAGAASLNNTNLQEMSYGVALGTAFNTRLCQFSSTGTNRFRALSEQNKRKKGIDFTKCDDLVIGAPLRGDQQRGSIFYCKASMGLPNHNGFGNIIAWTCEEHYPNIQSSALGSINLVKHYGASLLGVPNFNGYPLINTENELPNVTGALFIGAPLSTVISNSNAGVVFAYYMTPELVNSSANGFSAVFSVVNPADPKHDIHVSNQVACNSTNNNRSISAGVGACHNQVIYPSPATADNQFGKSLAAVKDVENLERGIHSLAVSAPYRAINSQDGSRMISQHGAVYLFKGDISQLGFDNGIRLTAPQLRINNSPTCTAGCTRYSGGLNPAGPTLIYPFNLTEASWFGIGSMAGDDFDGDNASDIAIGAPRHSWPTFYNGGAWVFTSKGNFAPTENLPFAILNTNISKEINYKFERAKVVGDLNGDGFDDVVTHIARPNRVELVVFYGSLAGLKVSPAPSRIPAAPLDPLLVVVDDDLKFGQEFYRIGSVNGDAYDDILVFGDRGSYIYHGSLSGLVTALQPSLTPNGQSALRFASGLGANSLQLHGGQTYGHSTPSALSLPGVSFINRHVAYGDYNGDGFSDFAVATNTRQSVSVLNPNGISYNDNQGRIWVFYGSPQGIQVNRTQGRTNYSSNEEVAGNQPCNALNQCLVQVLASPVTSLNGLFGLEVATLESRSANQNGGRDSLLVSAPGLNSNEGSVFLFRGSQQGLMSGGASTGVVMRVTPPAGSNQYFGSTLSLAGDINGDDFSDIVVVAAKGNSNQPLIYILYGTEVNGGLGFNGLNTDNRITSALGANRQHVLANSVQRIIWDSTLTSLYKNLGTYVSKTGDLNQDGFDDIILSAPLADYNQDITLPEVGAYIIFFGSAKGLMIGNAINTVESVDGVIYPPSMTPQCYQGASPRCDPLLIYLPNSNNNETNFLSDSAQGDFNGDGVPDLLLGSPGRHHPSSQAYGTGVFYVY